MDYSNFIILLARQRSGTHALRSMLEAHPDIFGVEEVFHLRTAEEPNPGLPIPETNFFGFLKQHVKGDLLQLLPVDYEPLFLAYLHSLRALTPKRYLVLDVKYNIAHHIARSFQPLTGPPYLFELMLKHGLRTLWLTRRNYLRAFVSILKTRRTENFHTLAGQTSSADKKVRVNVGELGCEFNHWQQEDELVRTCFTTHKRYRGKFFTWDYAELFEPGTQRLSDAFAKRFSKWLRVRNEFSASCGFQKLSSLPLRETIENYGEVSRVLRGTPFEHCLNDEPPHPASESGWRRWFRRKGPGKDTKDAKDTKGSQGTNRIDYDYEDPPSLRSGGESDDESDEMVYGPTACKEEERAAHQPGYANAACDALPSATTSSAPRDNAEFQEIFEAVRRYTMLSKERLFSLFTHAKALCLKDVPGQVVECGVAAGGSSALLAGVVRRFSRSPRCVFACDSFEGLPTPGELDRHDGQPAATLGWSAGTCAASVDSLWAACRAVGAETVVEPVRGFFAESLPVARERIGPIALLHMDGDWYDSTRTVLGNLYDQVVPGGIIQIDDYGYWEGCQRAVAEFQNERGLVFDLHVIDETGVWMEKPSSAGNAGATRENN